jgi:hypothetical protein
VTSQGDTPLTLDEAVWKLNNCSTPPGKERGRVWYEVAMTLYAELRRLRAESFGAAPALSEEERMEAFEEQKKVLPTYSICSVTSKRSYASERAALEASRGIQHKLRTYFCDLCRGWHVTKEHR